jgi:hypothetical protein
MANLTKCYKYTAAREDIPREKLMFSFIYDDIAELKGPVQRNNYVDL